MPRRGAIALTITGIALVLLLNFKTPDAAATLGPTRPGTAVVASPAAVASEPAVETPAAADGAATPAASQAAAAGSGTTTASKSGTYTGSAVQTRFGPVQVQITVSNGQITAVDPVQYPSFDRHSLQVSQYAIPTLIQETLQAQNAQVDVVSGATITSDAYMTSLQSAIDRARG